MADNSAEIDFFGICVVGTTVSDAYGRTSASTSTAIPFWIQNACSHDTAGLTSTILATIIRNTNFEFSTPATRLTGRGVQRNFSNLYRSLIARFDMRIRGVWTGTMVLLFCASGFAQQSVPPFSEGSDAEKTKHIATAWTEQNRYLEVSVGQRRQYYQEADATGLTANGILNTETGKQAQTGVVLRWQTASDWLFQLEAHRQSGVTDYDGYLQTGGGGLTPFRASTGNISTQFNAYVGYALNTKSWNAMPEVWQVTPLIQFARHHWQRNLVQYSETYSFNSYSVGVFVQWQARPGTVLEAQVLAGRTQSANVSAPQLGFIARQPGADHREIRVGVIQSLSSLSESEAFKGWHATVRFKASQYQHGASPLVNGLQAPPNQSKPTGWTLGLQRQF